MTLNEIHINVTGTNADDVQRVASALIKETDMKSSRKHSNPWVSGSFYLTVFIVVIVILLVAAKMINMLALPLVLIGGLLALSTIGALQLRQDNQLSQKNFLELMILTFKYLPWLKKENGKTSKSK